MKRKNRGFTIIDSMIGVMVLLMGALSFTAALPVVSRSQKVADDQSKAVQIAQWQVEQVRQAGFLNLSFERLYPLGLVDDWNGSGPMTFTTAPNVESGRFSPSLQLRDGVGELVIEDASDSIREVRVTVKWKSPAGNDRSVMLSTLVGRD